MNTIPNVLSFGAVGDGITDDTAAMQAAHNTGRPVYYPAGTYLFTSGLTIQNGGIVGDGMTQTRLKSNDTSGADLITYTGNYSADSNVPTFKDFSLVGTFSKTSGTGLAFNPATDETEYAHFSNVTFGALPIGLAIERGSLWKIIGCNFLSCAVAGIRVRNLHVSDAGDSVVMGSVFNNPFSTGAGVLQQSSGGLKLVGNKFLGGGSAYKLNYDSSNGGTSVLVISDNSIEQMAEAGLVFENAAGSAPFSNVIIANNEFGVQPRAISVASSITLTEVAITGNIFNLNGGPGTPFGVAANNLNRFLIGDNIFRGNGGASVGISLVNCTNGKIGVNTYSGLSSAIQGSGNANVHVTKTVQSGTATTVSTGWWGYASLYRSPATVVTFPNPFLAPPTLGDVKAIPIGTFGEVSVIVTAVTASNFTCTVISGVPNIAAQIGWEASGIV